MTKKDYKPERDFDKYSWANTLGRIYSSEDHKEYLIGGLEGDAIKQGSNGEGLEAILRGTMASDIGQQTAIGYTQEQHRAEMQGLTVENYLTNYQDTIKKYFGEEEISNLNKYKGEELNALKKKIEGLMHDKSHPDKDKSKAAKKELKKYNIISAVFKVIEDEIYKDLIPKAIEGTNKYLAKDVILRNKQDNEE